MGGDLESSVSVVLPRLVMAPTRELACQIQLLGCSPESRVCFVIAALASLGRFIFEEYKEVMCSQ